jgi:hypothetical protein
MIPTFIALILGTAAGQNSQFGYLPAVEQPEGGIRFASMRRILRPTVVGVSAARHLVWYLNYQISGRNQVR